MAQVHVIHPRKETTLDLRSKPVAEISPLAILHAIEAHHRRVLMTMRQFTELRRRAVAETPAIVGHHVKPAVYENPPPGAVGRISHAWIVALP